MRILLFCVFFGWITLFGGIGCKRSSSDGMASARSVVTDGVADRLAGTLRRPAPRRKAPAPMPPQPNYLSRKAKPLPKALQQIVAGIGRSLQRVQSIYRKAFVKGKLKDWRAYYKAESVLSAVRTRYESIAGKLQQLDPMVAEQMSRSLRRLSRLIRAKASPQRTGHFAYAVLQAAYHANPNEKNALLRGYRASIKQIEQSLVAQRAVGMYKAGLLLMPSRPYVRLTEVGKRDVKTTIRPPKPDLPPDRFLRVGVERVLVGPERPHVVDDDAAVATDLDVLRHARTGVPLAGTHVSVEILNARSKRQHSTQKLHLMWDGAPKYIGHLKLPRKDQRVIVQVTVSPFPVSRTQYSRKMLRSRSTIHFRALVKGGALSFPKFKPKKGPKGGHDLMRAVSLVGGHINTDLGVAWRAGMGFSLDGVVAFGKVF